MEDITEVLHILLMIKYLLFISCIIVSFSSTSFGQWKKVFSRPGQPIYTVYFLDLPGPPRIGFVANFNELWRTNDGGTTWSIVTTNFELISDFSFKDSLTGWFSFRTGGVAKTIDGGLTWNNISHPNMLSGEAVYYSQTTKRLFLAGWKAGLWSTDNEGLTWNQIYTDIGGTGISFDFQGLNGVISFAN